MNLENAFLHVWPGATSNSMAKGKLLLTAPLQRPRVTPPRVVRGTALLQPAGPHTAASSPVSLCFAQRRCAHWLSNSALKLRWLRSFPGVAAASAPGYAGSALGNRGQLQVLASGPSSLSTGAGHLTEVQSRGRRKAAPSVASGCVLVWRLDLSRLRR